MNSLILKLQALTQIIAQRSEIIVIFVVIGIQNGQVDVDQPVGTTATSTRHFGKKYRK